MRDVLLFVGVFLACLVEAVEALTIVLAIGSTRGWRAAWEGVAAGLVLLAAVVALLGPTLTVIPIGTLRLIVGGLLLLFGLQWLRKAILRSGGFKALHDEEAAFAKEAAAARRAGTVKDPSRDWYGFTVAFKGVVLEGLEVAFIVVTVGLNRGSLRLAVAAALVAVLVVVALGMAVRHPLARVPENTLKLAVGLLLTSFGTFWSGEGAGVHWPGSDAAIIGLLAFYGLATSVLVLWLRRIRGLRPSVSAARG